MTSKQVLAQLKSLGTAQNRKVYRRHGVGVNQYGVSFAHLRKLAKQIKVDHPLAQDLWAAGNHDGRILAGMIADPGKTTSRELDAWVKDLDNYVVADQFAVFASQTPFARKKVEKWSKSKAEWTGRAGWQALAHVALSDDELPDDYFESYMGVVEKDIHSRKNRVRDAMNSALIAIGIRNPRLEKKALAVARAIGKVEVDHGETSCTTPDAAAYIRKTKKRKKR